MEIHNMSFFGITPFDAPKVSRNGNTVSVTVCRDQIVIPSYAYMKFGKPEWVEVGFNEDKKIFAIRPVKQQTKYAIEIKGRTKKNGSQITRKAVCDKIVSLVNFDAENQNLILNHGSLDTESGYWLFDLDGGRLVDKRSVKRSK